LARMTDLYPPGMCQSCLTRQHDVLVASKI